MAMTVVGLFDDAKDAKAALHDLADAGFKQSDTQTVSGNAKKVHGMLKDRGVPGTDIQAYEHGVQSGDSLVVLHANDDRAEAAREIMNRHNAIDIHHAGQVRSMTTATATATTAAPAMKTPTHTAAAGETVTVPIVEEHLSVGKREIQRGGARIHTHVTEVPVTETVTLREEEVVVDRHAVNRPVSGTDLNNAFRETTIEVTEHDEVPVVAKQAVVVEEVTVGKRATERTETVRDTVRRTDVDIEELNEGDSSVMGTSTSGTTAGRR